MLHIDPSQAITLFVSNLPTFLAVALAWMHSNSRISDLDRNLGRRIDDNRDLLGAEFRRVEESWTARIQHLEERER